MKRREFLKLLLALLPFGLWQRFQQRPKPVNWRVGKTRAVCLNDDAVVRVKYVKFSEEMDVVKDYHAKLARIAAQQDEDDLLFLLQNSLDT